MEGTPIMFKYGFKSFLAGMDWYPTEKSFGLLPMIVGSLMVTLGALVIGVPLGLACAVFLTEFSSKRTRRIVKPVIELLAGIPSVVYGFMGVVILVPFIRGSLGGPGLSVLAASIILGIMILPDGHQHLGGCPPGRARAPTGKAPSPWGPRAGRRRKMVLFPAARSGIVASIILGMGRAIGETMAVIMVAGNAATVPGSAPRARPDPDVQHRPGDGLRERRAPPGPLRHRRHALRHHHDPEHDRQRDVVAAEGLIPCASDPKLEQNAGQGGPPAA